MPFDNCPTVTVFILSFAERYVKQNKNKYVKAYFFQKRVRQTQKSRASKPGFFHTHYLFSFTITDVFFNSFYTDYIGYDLEEDGDLYVNDAFMDYAE